MKKKFVLMFAMLFFFAIDSFAILRIVYRGCDHGVGSYDIYNGNNYVGSAKGACCQVAPGGKGTAVVNIKKDSEIGKNLLKLDPKYNLKKAIVYGSEESFVEQKKN